MPKIREISHHQSRKNEIVWVHCSGLSIMTSYSLKTYPSSNNCVKGVFHLKAHLVKIRAPTCDLNEPNLKIQLFAHYIICLCLSFSSLVTIAYALHLQHTLTCKFCNVFNNFLRVYVCPFSPLRLFFSSLWLAVHKKKKKKKNPNAQNYTSTFSTLLN